VSKIRADRSRLAFETALRHLISMSIMTTVEAGKIVLPPGVDWPDGTVVRIEQVEEGMPTLYETMKDFVGIADELPSDMAENHNHYLHGHTKK
jgi:hypothetical protein